MTGDGVERPTRLETLLLLGGGGLALAALTVWWVANDSRVCPPSDSEHHLFLAQLYARDLRLGGLGALWQTIRTSPESWPPATSLVHGLLAWCLGDEQRLVRGSTIVFLPVLLWVTYGVGRALADRRSGVLAALLTAFSLGVAGQLRQVSVDLPATVAVVLCVWALLHSEGFSRRRTTLLFGAACGLGLLVRPQLVIFLAGPTLVVAVRGLWRAPDNRTRARMLAGMGLALLVALVVSSPWWCGRLQRIFSSGTQHLGGWLPEGTHPLVIYAHGLFEFATYPAKLVGWPVLLAALITAPLTLRRQLADGLLLLSWGIGSALIYAATFAWEAHYMLPAIPALVLLAVLGLRGRRFLLTVLAVAVVVPTLAVVFLPRRAPRAWIGRWLVEQPYVGWPAGESYRWRPKRAAREFASALRRALPDPSGRSAYLLFLSGPRAAFLNHTAVFLVPELPELAFNTTLHRTWGTEWHEGARRQRQLFFLVEDEAVPHLSPLLTLTPGAQGNPKAIHLYQVPRGHQLQESTEDLHRLALAVWMNRGSSAVDPVLKRSVRWRDGDR